MLRRILVAQRGERLRAAARLRARALAARIPGAGAGGGVRRPLGRTWQEIVRGRHGVLTAEPVVALEKTTGSSGACKHIPYTVALSRAASRRCCPGWRTSTFASPSLHARRRVLVGQPARPPSASARRRDPGRLRGRRPVLRTAWAPALGRVMLTPPVWRASRTWRPAGTSPCGSCSRVRTSASSPSGIPSFFTLLLDAMPAQLDALMHDVERGHDVARLPPVPEGLRAALQARVRPRPARAARLRRLLAREGTLPAGGGLAAPARGELLGGCRGRALRRRAGAAPPASRGSSPRGCWPPKAWCRFPGAAAPARCWP